mgnify:CR=1 FL=1
MGLNLCDRCAADCRHERNPNEIVVKCGAYKPPMTNADRIRAMSDEGLAELLISADFCGECEYCDKVGLCRYYEANPDGILDDGCKQAAISWLRQSSD